MTDINDLTPVKISLNADGTGMIVIDGVDISEYVTRDGVSIYGGSPPLVLLTLHGPVEVDGLTWIEERE